MHCQFCNSENIQELGLLGSRWYVRCHACGMDSSVPEDEMFDDTEEPFERANRAAATIAMDDSDRWLEAEEYQNRFTLDEDHDPDVYENDDPEFDDYDGQPDEAQEWHDFDPDC